MFRPEEVYKHVRNVAPDLIVHFGGLAWRSIGGVGYPTIHVRENDTGPDDCNHAQHGAFVLAGLNSPLQGLDRGGPSPGHCADPAGAGRLRRSRRRCKDGRSPPDSSCPRKSRTGTHSDEEEIIRARLSGLGYIA